MGIPIPKSPALQVPGLEAESDPSEILSTYFENTSLKTEAFARLCELGCFSEAAKILQKELALPWNRTAQTAFCRILSAHPTEPGILDDIITLYIAQYPKYGCSYQQAQVCQIVSSLVSQNGRFPSKNHVIAHFKTLISLFQESQSLFNYMNAIVMLNTVEPLCISEEELELLCKCLEIRQEPFKREFFCGQRPKDVSTLRDILLKNINSQQSKSIKLYSFKIHEDNHWKYLIENKTKAVTEYSKEFIVFLEKIGMQYSIDNSVLSIGNYHHVGFTTRVYEIVKRYEQKVEHSVGEKTVNSVKSVISNSAKRVHGTTRVSTNQPNKPTNQPSNNIAKTNKTPRAFVNRFKKPLQEFKRVYSRITRVLNDEYFEERKNNQLERFTERNNKLEAEKKYLIERREVIEELLADIKKKAEEESVRRKKEEEEKQARERESSKRGIWDQEVLKKNRPPTVEQPTAGVYRSPYNLQSARSSSSWSRSGSSSSLPEERVLGWNRPTPRSGVDTVGERVSPRGERVQWGAASPSERTLSSSEASGEKTPWKPNLSNDKIRDPQAKRDASAWGVKKSNNK